MFGLICYVDLDLDESLGWFALPTLIFVTNVWADLLRRPRFFDECLGWYAMSTLIFWWISVLICYADLDFFDKCFGWFAMSTWIFLPCQPWFFEEYLGWFARTIVWADLLCRPWVWWLMFGLICNVDLEFLMNVWAGLLRRPFSSYECLGWFAMSTLTPELSRAMLALQVSSKSAQIFFKKSRSTWQKNQGRHSKSAQIFIKPSRSSSQINPNIRQKIKVDIANQPKDSSRNQDRHGK